jgi:tetratricopeptide (TPR) repeat protein
VIRALLFIVAALVPCLIQAQSSEEKRPARQAPPPARTPQPGDDLKEEDTSLTASKEYVFNPIQSAQELKVGKFYMKRGSFKAAAGRFEEALQWNPQDLEACTLLGEAREKLKDRKAARAAYEKCLALDPDQKLTAELKNRLKRLN